MIVWQKLRNLRNSYENKNIYCFNHRRESYNSFIKITSSNWVDTSPHLILIDITNHGNSKWNSIWRPASVRSSENSFTKFLCSFPVLLLGASSTSVSLLWIVLLTVSSRRSFGIGRNMLNIFYVVIYILFRNFANINIIR